jgi:MinD-like ATPase involved in chromosome partitioning or flagellar assembly/Sec-independent protein translocase protein TatA
MSLTPPDRRVITFYSFKGGVGRTMAVANVAYRLANTHGLKVIAVDWDLEAPGLHRFFGVSSADAAKGQGVLDYFAAWDKAVKGQEPEPPNVMEWVIPITKKKHKPRFGSVSLLLAGRLDETYDARLAALHWQDFYEREAGAAAVETLREQLVGNADVVLIDSRTGLTDAGGICTIQLPDGVVLMAAPNQQSLEGTDRVARAIANAPAAARAERARPGMWFVASRVPFVDESYLAEQWFAENAAWFAAGVEQGLWLKADHPEGIQSYKIPHRARWGFNEVVLNAAVTADANDLLAVSYDRLTETLLRWLRGEPPVEYDKKTSKAAADWQNIAAVEAEVSDAGQRGDMLGMAISLNALALGLAVTGRHDEAIRKAEQASGILLSRGARAQYMTSLMLLGWSLTGAKRFSEAEQVLDKVLAIAREFKDLSFEANLLRILAEAHLGQGAQEKALDALTSADRILWGLGEDEREHSLVFLVGSLFGGMGKAPEAARSLREAMRLARKRGELESEKTALLALIDISDAGANLPDAPALRARLAELSNAPPGTK